MMDNLFKNSQIATQFNEYSDVLEQILGYDFVFKTFDNSTSKHLLDYGCGPGKVSLRLAKTTKHRIVAVDESEKMIEIAKHQRAHERITYNVIQHDQLDNIADNSLDGAFACYVFINNQSESRIFTIMKSIYRVLKTNGEFIILDTNPNTTGVPFSTFQNGETDRQYHYGENRQEWLHVDQDTVLTLNDFHWPNEMYEKNLKNAGFIDISVRYPILDDLTPEELSEYESQYHFNRWSNEKDVPPFIIYKAKK